MSKIGILIILIFPAYPSIYLFYFNCFHQWFAIHSAHVFYLHTVNKNTRNQTAFPVWPLWSQKVWALLPIIEQLVVANDGLVRCPLIQFSSDIICLESGWGTMRAGSVLKTGLPLSYQRGQSQAPGCFTSASNMAWIRVPTTPLALVNLLEELRETHTCMEWVQRLHRLFRCLTLQEPSWVRLSQSVPNPAFSDFLWRRHWTDWKGYAAFCPVG